MGINNHILLKAIWHTKKKSKIAILFVVNQYELLTTQFSQIMGELLINWCEKMFWNKTRNISLSINNVKLKNVYRFIKI